MRSTPISSIVVEISVNGDRVKVEPGTTLVGLLEQLQLKDDRVAVERNRVIVARADWESTVLEAGDTLEIVHFVGGG